VAAVVFGATAVSAQHLQTELVDLLDNHPQIRAQRSTVESARKGIDRAYSRYLPRLDLSGNIGPSYIETDTRDQLGLGPFDETQKVARVSITQNVFNGFQTPAQVRIARLNTEVATQTLTGTEQEVLFTGIKAYLDILRHRRLVELARLNEDSIRLQAQLEDERVIRGAGITVDVLQAKSRLQIAKEQRVAFEGALEDAISRYVQVFDHAPNTAAMTDPTPPVDLLPPTIEDALAIATAESPAISGSLATVEVASQRRTLARSDYFPTIDVVGAMDYEEDFDLQPGVRRDSSVLVQATWNLFNGFATSSGVAQAAHDYRASQDNHEFVNRGVVEATRLAWQQLRTAREREELLSNAISIAEEVLESRRKLREAGKETVINVLISEDEVNQARINFTVARYDAATAVYQVLLAIGRLDPDHLALRGK
jgi:adhesin transport system outer membrane protein